MRRNLKHVICAVCLSATVVLAGLAGCSTNGRSASRRVEDGVVTHRVEGTLEQSQVYKFPDVEVKTVDGTVQLSGMVDTEAQKERAGQIAQQVRGVKEVVNGLTVEPQKNLTPTGSPTGRRYDATTLPPASNPDNKQP
jgi:Flp pilus assembly secretin CpaC